MHNPRCHRVDIVGWYNLVAVMLRRASGSDWRTNITSGGLYSVLREPNDELVELGKVEPQRCAGTDIGRVLIIIYDF